MGDIDFGALAEPFLPWDVEWRVSRAGKKGGQVWAKVLAYITNRAIMERLDEVVGPENWKNDYRAGPGGGVLAGIGIRIDGEWVWKWDGAENTEIESVKGGLSGSMKRAAVQWGIGRYLYGLDEGWANVHPDGEHYGRLPQDKGGDSFRWDPPELPGWALPEDAKKGMEPPVDKETGEITEEDPPADEATLVAISDALDALKGMDEGKYANAYKHYENNLDAIAGSRAKAEKFLGRCKATIEVLEAEESINEKVPA